VRFREERRETGHLRVGQPEEIAHLTAPFFRAVNHAVGAKSMHPDPNRWVGWQGRKSRFYAIQAARFNMWRASRLW
jgi:hypothetical protein